VPAAYQVLGDASEVVEAHAAVRAAVTAAREAADLAGSTPGEWCRMRECLGATDAVTGERVWLERFPVGVVPNKAG